MSYTLLRRSITHFPITQNHIYASMLFDTTYQQLSGIDRRFAFSLFKGFTKFRRFCSPTSPANEDRRLERTPSTHLAKLPTDSTSSKGEANAINENSWQVITSRYSPRSTQTFRQIQNTTFDSGKHPIPHMQTIKVKLRWPITQSVLVNRLHPLHNEFDKKILAAHYTFKTCLPKHNFAHQTMKNILREPQKKKQNSNKEAIVFQLFLGKIIMQ
ncbi:hypothetical protein EGR_07526 [Echinococcus granulosus]|uniref:Uncharacterized protein n=1 Tax=Echinococcus granulosus TaxID=6210 RepID=W6UVV8_ECHGR|nr:hypothetical protein EGR_07526 [Echinococcus granulosus]EUB57584.1 hypothetical protein EGR_07526 [Echinococcus granulosus]